MDTREKYIEANLIPSGEFSTVEDMWAYHDYIHHNLHQFDSIQFVFVRSDATVMMERNPRLKAGNCLKYLVKRSGQHSMGDSHPTPRLGTQETKLQYLFTDLFCRAVGEDSIYSNRMPDGLRGIEAFGISFVLGMCKFWFYVPESAGSENMFPDLDVRVCPA